MNYAWEAALAADRMGISRETMRYIPIQSGSPYAEVVLKDINGSILEDMNVEINPLYRFSKEFAAIFDINQEEYEKTRILLFDIYLQYMVQLDLRQGLSRQEYMLRFFLGDLLKGACGPKAAEALNRFKKEDLRQLLFLIKRLYQNGSSLFLFREAIRCIYPKSLIYANNENTWQILVYVGKKQNREEQIKLEFLQEMFLPINYQIYLFWEHHFGIIDVDETMVMDEMVLF